ncbi:hypothetical protein GCM10010358_79590 [Streptomyces minutiscleroticus]|uniref:Uncharacterized protein n=1 Tax=Streptomyces minutiscleroticus TaxID=68238 RepID=A0A918P2Z2_9ACTN|nr:hypothetical protein GCM10010358_79590 [Streptomyces minutiscleroticus]
MPRGPPTIAPLLSSSRDSRAVAARAGKRDKKQAGRGAGQSCGAPPYTPVLSQRGIGPE